jgi:hypothetical protein
MADHTGLPLMAVNQLTARRAVAAHFLALPLTGCLFFLLLTTSTFALPFGKSSGINEHTLIMTLDAPEADVVQVVQAVVNDQIIHGTQQYAKEKILFGAHSTPSSSALGPAETAGKVFYKVAEKVLAPQNFRDAEAMGTITVRYIVQGTGPGTTSIQIDALYVEDDRRRPHRSEGVVESAEYAEIQKKLQDLQTARNKPPEESVQSPAVEPVNTDALDSFTGMEQRLQELRKKVELRVKASSSLRSAPYRGAAAIQPLPAGSELLVMVVTPYWYGVETPDGHRGWVHHSEVESLP